MNVPAGLKQPDQRSCGASCLVLAASLASGTPLTPDEFGPAALAAHRRLTSLRLRGRVQLPWPRAIGTPPWAVARELTALTGVRHRTRIVRWHRSAPLAGALYVGNAWLPRHVLLVLDDGRCYNPATGRVVAADDPTLTRWRTRWFEISPVRPAGRRTRA